jgi:acyl-[acyl-carrier-protein]-phospholipid O-acyltransferase/long-chain-fatty-acid--[acyl-carrier-protein] ligase
MPSRSSAYPGRNGPAWARGAGAQAAPGADTQIFAVTAVPDERKGERLAVLPTLDDIRLPNVLEKFTANGLPNLFMPRRDHFVRVGMLPMLGSGKLNLREVQRIAMDTLMAMNLNPSSDTSSFPPATPHDNAS